MTPRRAAVLAAAVAMLLAGLYLGRRKRRTPAATSDRVGVLEHVSSDVPREGAVPVPVPEQSPEPAVAVEPVEPVEPPLPTWMRAAIVAVALLAFFAVSLIATKGV